MELFILLIIPSILCISLIVYLLNLKLFKGIFLTSFLIIISNIILKLLGYKVFNITDFNTVLSYPILYIKMFILNVIINIIISTILIIVVKNITVTLEKKVLNDYKKNKNK